jgi:hypothetical protein
MEKLTPKELLKEFNYPVVSVDLTSIRGVYRTLTELRDWATRLMAHMTEEHVGHIKASFPDMLPEIPEESIFYSLPVTSLHNFLVNFRQTKEYWNKNAIQIEVCTNLTEQEDKLQAFLCSIFQNTILLIQDAIRTPTEVRSESRNQHPQFPGVIGQIFGMRLQQMPPQEPGEEDQE